MKTLKEMPPHGSLGESIATRFLLRNRFVEGFKLWQQVFASAFSQTEAFALIADEYGSILSNFPVVRPMKVPTEWDEVISEMFRKASYELQVEAEKAKAGDDGRVVAAKNYRTDEELLKIAENLGD